MHEEPLFQVLCYLFIFLLSFKSQKVSEDVVLNNFSSINDLSSSKFLTELHQFISHNQQLDHKTLQAAIEIEKWKMSELIMEKLRNEILHKQLIKKVEALKQCAELYESEMKIFPPTPKKSRKTQKASKKLSQREMKSKKDKTTITSKKATGHLMSPREQKQTDDKREIDKYKIKFINKIFTLDFVLFELAIEESKIKEKLYSFNWKLVGIYRRLKLIEQAISSIQKGKIFEIKPEIMTTKIAEQLEKERKVKAIRKELKERFNQKPSYVHFAKKKDSKKTKKSEKGSCK